MKSAKAAIVQCQEGRIYVSRIKPAIGGDGTICLELHRGEQGKAIVTVFFMILTRDEAVEVGHALTEVAE
jgi:hypothetical protein